MLRRPSDGSWGMWSSVAFPIIPEPGPSPCCLKLMRESCMMRPLPGIRTAISDNILVPGLPGSWFGVFRWNKLWVLGCEETNGAKNHDVVFSLNCAREPVPVPLAIAHGSAAMASDARIRLGASRMRASSSCLSQPIATSTFSTARRSQTRFSTLPTARRETTLGETHSICITL